jgi:hypothetical protein
MSGAELGTPEFAYLLAAVHAGQVIGLDAPDLFPKSAKDRDAVYGQGRRDLEKNGWIKKAAGHEDEFELNPILYELVSTIAWPQYVVATIRQGRSQEGLAMHYLSGDSTVELAALESDRFRIGIVPDRGKLWARLAGMLQMDNAKPKVQARLTGAAFKKLVAAAEKGKDKDAQALLDDAEGNGSKATSLIPATNQPIQGHVVLLPVRDGKPGEGRRATVLGKGDQAWIVYASGSDGKSVGVVNGCARSLDSLLADWLDDLAE